MEGAVSTRTTTPAPTFGLRSRAASEGVATCALRHMHARTKLWTGGGTPLAGLLSASMMLAVFTASSTISGAAWLAFVLTVGGFLYLGNHRAAWGQEPLLPVPHRVRIAADAAVVTLLATLPTTLLLTAGHAFLVSARRARMERYPAFEHEPMVGLDEALLQGLAMLVLAYPLLAAGLRLPPAKGNARYILPGVLPALLLWGGWALGLTEGLPGCLALALAMTAIVLLTSDRDWDGPLPWQGLIRDRGEAGPLHRACSSPQARLTAEFRSGLVRQAAFVLGGTAAAWALWAAFAMGDQGLPMGLMMVVLLLFQGPRMLGLASTMNLPFLAPGLAAPFDRGPWALMPVQRRELERRSLNHALLIGGMTIVADLGALWLFLPQVEHAPTARMMLMIVGIVNAVLPWYAGFIQLIRFRWRGAAGSFAALVALALGVTVTTFLSGSSMGGALLAKLGILGPWAASPLPAVAIPALLAALSWALVASVAWATRPRREPA